VGIVRALISSGPHGRSKPHSYSADATMTYQCPVSSCRARQNPTTPEQTWAPRPRCHSKAPGTCSNRFISVTAQQEHSLGDGPARSSAILYSRTGALRPRAGALSVFRQIVETDPLEFLKSPWFNDVGEERQNVRDAAGERLYIPDCARASSPASAQPTWSIACCNLSLCWSQYRVY
jgi:hypothetical protein